MGARRRRRVLRVRARGDRPAARHRGRLRRRPRGPAGELPRRPRVGLRRRLACTSSPTRRSTWTTASVWGRGESAEKVWRRYFETVAEAARTGHVRHHGPPRPGEGLGRRRAGAGAATCGATTSRRSRASSRAAWRSRSRPRGCASRSARSTRRARSWRWRSTPGCPIALSSDAHAPDQLGFRYEDALELLERGRRRRDLRVRAAGSGGWSRSADAHRASASTRIASRTGRPLILGGVEIPGASAGWRATPTPTCSPTRSSTRCSARPGSATSASSSPTPTSCGATPTRWRCCATCVGRVAGGGLGGRARRRHRGARAPEARPAPRRDPRRRWRACSAQRQRQVHDRRGDGLRRPRGGRRRAGGRHARAGSVALS